MYVYSLYLVNISNHHDNLTLNIPCIRILVKYYIPAFFLDMLLPLATDQINCPLSLQDQIDIQINLFVNELNKKMPVLKIQLHNTAKCQK